MWHRNVTLALALGMTCWATGCQREETASTLSSPTTGVFPFDFSLTSVTGEPIKLAELKGKVVVVDFWGTWCPPCRREVPSFVKLQDLYGDQGLQIVGLNFEDEGQSEVEQHQAVVRAIEQLNINYPCALGTKEVLNQVPFFKGFPTTLFIDRQGKVRLKIVGLYSYEDLEHHIKTLLAE